MELVENLNLNNNKNDNDFFQTSFGKIINQSIESGLRILLPEFIEEDIIGIKDTLIQEGFSEAVNEAIGTAVDLGKSALGIVTGNFENISQAEMAIEKGGLIDSISKALDFILDKVKDAGLISKDVTKVIKKGKDTILDNVSSNIKSEFSIQTDKIEKLKSYNEKWKKAFNNQDFKKMEQSMKNINKLMSDIMPVESVINDSREIENLHELIKNNGQNFDLTQEELDLAKRLP